MKTRQLALVACVTAALGTTAGVSAADLLSVGMDFKAYVTMLDPTGDGVKNSSFADDPEYMGYRTPITGKMVMNITEMGLAGAAAFEPFLFFGMPASGRDLTFVPADSLFGTPVPSNTLLVGNMLFDWAATTGIPVSIVLDMASLSSALQNAELGDVITGVMRGASDNTLFLMPDGTRSALPVGPVVVGTTTWNTTDVDTDGDGQPGPVVLDTNPSGTVPLLVDTVVDMSNGDIGIGGSPMRAGPFVGFNANFDITEVTVTCMSALTSCNSDGLSVPALPISPQPLEPIQDDLGGLVKKLGL